MPTMTSAQNAFRPERRSCGLNPRESPANVGNPDQADGGPAPPKAVQIGAIRVD